MYNILGNELKPLNFQQKIIDKVENKNALICMPTGSGKSLVAYSWSDILHYDYKKTIITAPTKAVSCERYTELTKQNSNLNIALITGDVKTSNTMSADILVMTQEIYNNNYTNDLANVIIDEFHYSFSDSSRARSYIESIEKTNPKSKLLLMSATIQQPQTLAKWLSNLANRKIIAAETSERLVPIKYSNEGIKCNKVRDAIVFCFSRRAIKKVIDNIIHHRYRIEKRKIKEISELANQFNIEFMNEWEYGISRYHGKLLPKEKMLVEYLFRHNYIDTIVGTDSLALGVNTPAKYAIIAQTYKPTGERLKSSEFYQLCGRAGRYGYHDIGIATFLKDSPVASIEGIKYDIEKEFSKYINKNVEATKIDIDVDIRSLLNGKFLEEEAETILKYSYPFSIDKYDSIFFNVKKESDLIDEKILEIKNRTSKMQFNIFIDLFKNYYLPEWDLLYNIDMDLFISKQIEDNGIIKTDKIIDRICLENENIGMLLYELLLANKWLKSIRTDEKYSIKNFSNLIDTINKIDETVFNPDLRL